MRNNKKDYDKKKIKSMSLMMEHLFHIKKMMSLILMAVLDME